MDVQGYRLPILPSAPIANDCAGGEVLCGRADRKSLLPWVRACAASRRLGFEASGSSSHLLPYLSSIERAIGRSCDQSDPGLFRMPAYLWLLAIVVEVILLLNVDGVPRGDAVARSASEILTFRNADP